MIGLQVCFHSAMKHENNVSDMIGCLQIVSMQDIKVYIRALQIVFLIC